MANITGSALDLTLPHDIQSMVKTLENCFPDTHPRVSVSEFELGFQAGAIEVIRRLKEYSSV
jgi:hypothetical protein